jgi:hypothetical protein
MKESQTKNVSYAGYYPETCFKVRNERFVFHKTIHTRKSIFLTSLVTGGGGGSN